MNFKRFSAAFLSSAFLLTLSLQNNTFNKNNFVFADEAEPTLHTISFLDFNGDTLGQLEVEHGKAIDYTQIDTSVLNYHIDKYTEVRFLSWDTSPKNAESDLTIQALYEQAKIKLSEMPTKKEYFSKNGSIVLDGLKVTITMTVQTAEFNKAGNRVTKETITDISESCTASPTSLMKAFTSSDNVATINIYPQGSKISLASYDITYFENLGDINLDSNVNAIDASIALSYYAATSTGKTYELTDEQFKKADIDRNNIINAIDASKILSYYALSSTGNNPDWEIVLK